MPEIKKDDERKVDTQSKSDEIVDAATNLAMTALKGAKGAVGTAAKAAGAVSLGVTAVEEFVETKDSYDREADAFVCLAYTVPIRTITTLAQDTNTVAAYITKDVPILGAAMAEIAQNDDEVVDGILNSARAGCAQFVKEGRASEQAKWRERKEKYAQQDLDMSIKRKQWKKARTEALAASSINNLPPSAFRLFSSIAPDDESQITFDSRILPEELKLVLGVEMAKYPDHVTGVTFRSGPSLDRTKRPATKATPSSSTDSNNKMTSSVKDKKDKSIKSTSKSPKIQLKTPGNAKPNIRQNTVSVPPAEKVHLSMDEVNSYINTVSGKKVFTLTQAEWNQQKAQIGFTDENFKQQFDILSYFVTERPYKKQHFNSEGSFGFKAQSKGMGFHSGSGFPEYEVDKSELAKPNIQQSYFTQENYMVAMQGTKILAQLGEQLNSPIIVKAAVGLSSAVTAGFAVAALFKNTAAMTAIGVSNPLLLGGLAVTSIVSAIGVFGNSGGNDGLEQIYDVIKELKSEIIELRINFNERMDRSDEFHKTTIELVKKLYADSMDHLEYLHYKSINIENRLGVMEGKIDASFELQGAKLDELSSQALFKILDEITPFLKGKWPLELMKSEDFVKYMGSLYAYLTRDVKSDVTTHRAVLNKHDLSLNSARVYNELRQISVHPAALSSRLGLLTVYMQQIGIEISENAENTLLNPNLLREALGSYLKMREIFNQYPYDTAQRDINSLYAQSQAFLGTIQELKKNEIWSQLWMKREQAVEKLQMRVNQVIQSSGHKMVVESLDSIIHRMSLRHFPANPNLQPFLQLERTFRVSYETYESASRYLSQGLPGYNFHVLSADYHHTHYSPKTESVKRSFQVKNPLADRGQQFFTFLSANNLKIPGEIYLGEYWNLLNVVTTTHFSLLNWGATFKSIHGTFFTLSDSLGPNAFGLNVNVHINGQVFNIFQPRAGFLFDDNRANAIPVFDRAIGRELSYLEQNQQLSPNYAWDLITTRAKEVVIPTSGLSQSVAHVRGHLITAFLNKRTQLSREVLLDVKDSPQMNDLLAIDQVIVSLATYLGFPDAIVQQLANNLTLKDPLAFFRLNENRKASKELPLTLNLAGKNEIQALQAATHNMTGNIGQAEDSLRMSLGDISAFQLTSLIKNNIKNLQDQANAQQLLLKEAEAKCSNILNSFSMVQQYLPSPNSIKRISKELYRIKEAQKNLVQLFEENTPLAEESKEKLEEKTIYPEKTFKDQLQNLCANKHSSITEINVLLQELEQERKLESALNNVQDEERPIHLAIEANKRDVVALLLEYGAVTNDLTLTLIEEHADAESKSKILALINFYKKMQISVSGFSAFEVRRALVLMSQYSSHLSSLGIIKSADFLMGPSGHGKSSLLNFLHGCQYLRQFGEDGQPFLALTENSIPEFSETSSSSASKTSCPRVVKISSDQHMVDLGGMDDTRGEAWKVANAASISMLSKSVESSRALIVVIDAAMFGIRDKAMDVLNEVGKMIDQRKELLPNVVLLVNKALPEHVAMGPAMIKSRLRKYIKELDLSDSTLFLLENLTEKQIFLMDVPTPAMRVNLLKHLDNIQPQPMREFNFGHHKELAHFQKLLQHLGIFQSESCEHLLDLQHSFGHSLINEIDQVQHLLDGSFSFDSSDLDEKNLHALLKQQHQMKSMVAGFLNTTREYVDNCLASNSSNILQFGSRHLYDIKQAAVEVQISKQFLSKVTSIQNPSEIVTDKCEFLPSNEPFFMKSGFRGGLSSSATQNKDIPFTAADGAPESLIFSEVIEDGLTTGYYSLRPELSAAVYQEVAASIAQKTGIEQPYIDEMLQSNAFELNCNKELECSVTLDLSSETKEKFTQLEKTFADEAKERIRHTNVSTRAMMDSVTNLGIFFSALLYKKFGSVNQPITIDDMLHAKNNLSTYWKKYDMLLTESGLQKDRILDLTSPLCDAINYLAHCIKDKSTTRKDLTYALGFVDSRFKTYDEMKVAIRKLENYWEDYESLLSKSEVTCDQMATVADPILRAMDKLTLMIDQAAAHADDIKGMCHFVERQFAFAEKQLACWKAEKAEPLNVGYRQ